MDSIKTLFGFALLLAFSVASGLAGILLDSLLALVWPVACMLVVGAAAHMTGKLFVRGFKGATFNDVA